MLFRGDESPYSTSRGSCLEPKDLSESLHLNQISIFMSGRFKHWVGNQYNLNCSGCIPAQMGLSPDPLKLPQIAFRVCFFFPPLTLFPRLMRSLSKKKEEKLRNRLSSFLQLTSLFDCHPRCLFLFVPDSLNETPRQWEQRRRGSRGSAAAERGEGKDLCVQGGWDWEHYSQISICVSFCDSAWERESNVLCECVFICVCVCACRWLQWRKGGKGIRGEAWDEENERAA